MQGIGFAEFAASLALRDGPAFLLDFKDGPVSVCAAAGAVAFDAAGTRVFTVIDNLLGPLERVWSSQIRAAYHGVGFGCFTALLIFA